MRLDITANSKIASVACDRWDACWQEHSRLHANDHFAARADGITEGCYVVNGETLSFRAGSYSGYNEWRSTLCLLVLGVPASAVFADPGNYEGRPFYELINFSDCEGVIGPKTCAKLARDFAAHRALALVGNRRVPPLSADADVQRFPHDMWSIAKWDAWQRAFELGADGGAVQFH